MERVGKKVTQMLNGSDLWGSRTCGRRDCLPCGRTGGYWEEPEVTKEAAQGEVSPGRE